MILVTGATGQLATAFRPLLPDATYVSRQELDLARPYDVEPFLDRVRPEVIINCGAYTAVDAAEADEDTARQVNAVSVAEMAAWVEKSNARLVTFSTDYVFDGRATEPYTESSQTGPISAYGRTKLEGEGLALQRPGTLVIRTSWLLSGTHRNFVSTMLDLAGRQSLRVVNDQRGCPTIADDLASATVKAIEQGAVGLLHLTNQGATTWFELARSAIELYGLDPGRVSPCRTDEFPRPAPRPANSVLASERLEALGLAPLPIWRDSLPALVDQMRGWLSTSG